ncbi:MAG: enoyl-CoA hydratase/isomerase family protein [Treponema sp.]|nr:enoyl-CoA hydratase/isomerase family protein [Treponema sp.]
MLEVRVEDGIAIAEFANGKYNSVRPETLAALGDVVRRVEADEALKGLVLTGRGRTFCSGFDLPTFLGFPDHAAVVRFFSEVADPVFLGLFGCRKPVVAALNGAAVAGGLILAMACDLRVAVDNPKIQLGMSEIKIGLGLSPVHAEILRFGLGGAARFRDVCYGGERYPVNAAKEMGMVDELVAEGELLPRAKAIVASWYDNPGHAFGLLKRSLRGPVIEATKRIVETSDWQEGFRCFFDPSTRAAMELMAKSMA